MDSVFHHLMGGGVNIQIVCGPGVQAVKADAEQIEQVIINMAMNARDAMPNGGLLTLETANMSFDRGDCGSLSGIESRATTSCWRSRTPAWG